MGPILGRLVNMTDPMPKKVILLVTAATDPDRARGLVKGFPSYEVITLENGEAALELARRKSPDLVILDSQLKDMDGFQACLVLRRLISTHLPILVLTEPREAVLSKEPGPISGADDYLPRNSNEFDFHATVRTLLEMKQALDDLHARLDTRWHSYPILRQLALTDHLTGLYNRFFLSEILDREAVLSMRYHTPLTGMLLEVDHLQEICFQHGSAVSDWALQSVASLIRTTIRQEDLISRFDKEVCAILMPMINGPAGVEMGQRLRKLVEAYDWDGPAGALPLTISVGVAAFSETAMLTPDELWHKATEALCHAKSEGGNTVSLTE
jgi:two-component system, cell cycle response regulator